MNQRKLSEFCKARDIVITAYSPLGSPDRPWAKPDDPKLMEDKKLIELGKKYNKSPAQVLIRYQVSCGIARFSKDKARREVNNNDFTFSFFSLTEVT